MKRILAPSVLAASFALMSCGDDVTKVYENPGIALLDAGEKLSEQTCDSKTAGETLFVMDSSAAFICDGENWVSMKGADGKSEKGKNGAGCSAAKVTKDDRSGVEITCGGAVVDTLWNGVDGEDGKDAKAKDGKDGASCTAAKVIRDDRRGVEITCGGAVVDTLWNGVDGEDGKDAKAKDGKDGASCTAAKVTKDDRSGVEITCGGAVVDTLWNGIDGEDGVGTPGEPGEPGEDGASCSAAKVTKDDRSGIEITCDNEVVDTLWNGVDGQKGKDGEDGVGTPGEPGEPGKDGAGCKIVTGRSNEIMVIVCGEGEAADTTKLEMCNDKIYDSMHSFCDPRDYQIYKFVTIGVQTWMAQNMNYNADGSVVGNVNLAVYGRLYAKDNMEKVCPSGWHLPVREEWDLLFATVGDNYKMELTADSGWDGAQGLDSYGLALTPAGWCNLSGSKCTGDGSLFSYRPKGEDHVYQLSPTFNRPRDDDYKASVRCVRD